jgi:hypothetical protein
MQFLELYGSLCSSAQQQQQQAVRFVHHLALTRCHVQLQPQLPDLHRLLLQSMHLEQEVV